MMKRLFAAAALATVLTGGPAAAQNAQQWTAQTAGETRLAYAVFPPGLAVIARCQGGQTLELLIQGLAVQAPTVEGLAQFDDHPAQDVTWTRSADGRYLIADHAAMLIRGLAASRLAHIQIGADADTGVPFSFPPPSDGAPLLALLDACGQPRVSARDTAEFFPMPAEGGFVREPHFRLPPRAVQANISGWAQVTCLVAEGGRLTECEVEDESPRGLGFGEAALATMPSVILSPDIPVGRLVAIKLISHLNE